MAEVDSVSIEEKEVDKALEQQIDLLISESGGKITSMYGEDLEFNTELINHENGLLVTNGLIHNKIVKKYSEFLNSQSQSE